MKSKWLRQTFNPWRKGAWVAVMFNQHAEQTVETVIELMEIVRRASRGLIDSNKANNELLIWTVKHCHLKFRKMQIGKCGKCC